MPQPVYPIRRERFLGAGVPFVNRHHPLTPFLQAAYVPSAFGCGHIPNLAAPGIGDLVTATGTPVLAPTPDGHGLNCGVAAAAKNVSSANTPLGFQMATGMSAFVRGLWVGYSGANVPDNVLGIVYNATPFWAWGIIVGPPNANGGVLNTVAYVVDQGTSTFTNNNGANSSPGDGNMFSAAFVGTGAASNRLYLNGVLQTNSANVTLNANHYGSASPQIQLGNNNSARSGGSVITVAYIFNTLLTQGQITDLHMAPYGPLLWPSDMIMANLVKPTVAPGTPTPPNNSIYWMPLTIGGGAMAAERWLRRRKVQMRRLRGE